MKPDDMVVVDLNTGKTVEGKWKPSSDTKTHLEIYRAFSTVGGITHTHSINAVAFAKAGMDIPALGTTHADYFYGPITCTRELTKEEVEEVYELNTGKVIVECLKERGIDPLAIPGIVVKNHGLSVGVKMQRPLCIMQWLWKQLLKTLALNPQSSMAQYVLDKHTICGNMDRMLIMGK